MKMKQDAEKRVGHQKEWQKEGQKEGQKERQQQMN
jgi:hypothetical protein